MRHCGLQILLFYTHKGGAVGLENEDLHPESIIYNFDSLISLGICSLSYKIIFTSSGIWHMYQFLLSYVFNMGYIILYL